MKESLSALMDNEIKEEELEALLLALKREPALKTSYLAWQIASVSMQKLPVFSIGLSKRLSARLAAEPVLNVLKKSGFPHRRQPVRWSLAASFLLVTLMTWYQGGERINTKTLIPTSQVISKNEGLNDYWAAHRFMVGGATVQKDLGYAVYQPGQVSTR
jgi:hypothetical protein